MIMTYKKSLATNQTDSKSHMGHFSSFLSGVSWSGFFWGPCGGGVQKDDVSAVLGFIYPADPQ